MSDSRFVHLHTHSHYSLLNALPTIDELVDRAKEEGMAALALTDNGNLYGAIEFYQACKKAEIKPIIGIDAYLAPRTLFDKEPHDKPHARIVLLAQNNEGYRNLMELVTQSYMNGFYYRPRLDRAHLEKYQEGIIAIIPSFSGETSHALKNDDVEKARATLSWYQSIFKDRCYLEITHHPEIAGHMDLMKKIVALSKTESVPLVAAHDTYYLDPEDRRAREVMVKIGMGGTVDTTSGMNDRNEDFSFISQDKAVSYFKDYPEALQNTLKIADSCSVEITLGSWYFPDFPIASGKTPDEQLEEEARKGLVWRGLSGEEVEKRIAYELSVIKMKGYSKYFLVVADLINEARKQKILTTIRGSVASSLVTYSLGITTVDPLEYKLPFERFLNPERPSAPDIDMDYADNRRDEMIDYARRKYGADKVAQIGTFGTMMARAAVRDVARALGHPYGTGDRIAKLIPMGSQGFAMTIERAIDIEPDLKELYKKDPDTKEIIDLAKKIEGKARHISVHAAGVVISPEPLTHFVPVQPDPKGGKIITQYDMYSVGEDGVGLLKFDFLGIKNLAILAESVKRVARIRNIDVDIENVPIDDKLTFEMLARGETMGVFQMGGSGMTHFLKELKPSSIHDINAMVALYRPGPMESIPQYIERKHNPRLITYLDPRLKDILDRSYGVVTYQDDVLMVAITLAGYSWLEADKLRKAMGKKIPAVMEAEKEKLLKGFAEYGKLTPDKGEKLWKLIEPFAAYGFNKAHAASYGRVAYQTAYMKANYPVEYMSAVLTADSGDVEKIYEIISECERMGIEILPPDVNESFDDFSVVPGTQTIRFGLASIKNFGTGVAEALIEERKTRGPFTSLPNFLSRVPVKSFNKKSLEALIMTGALDRFNDRGTLLHNVDMMLAYIKEIQAFASASQDSLFAGSGVSVEHPITLEPIPAVPDAQKLVWEKELLGVYVSGHPLDAYQNGLKKRPTIASVRADEREGVPVVVAGIIEESREIMTKKGDRMAFIKIGDKIASIEAVVFPTVLAEKRELCVPQKCVVIKGRLSHKNGDPSIVVEAIKELEKDIT
ncbi:DNA polymerase III subunit alpha [Patescibacteria group bacterium]|nr:DNA polymerase III subunit alpha [Patescibacteria group bacterium]